jgi:hypothetical protein
MTRPDPERLRRLHLLARMRADAETARLAATAQSRGRLQAALADLGQPESPLAPAAPCPEAAPWPAAAPASAGGGPWGPGAQTGAEPGWAETSTRVQDGPAQDRHSPTGHDPPASGPRPDTGPNPGHAASARMPPDAAPGTTPDAAPGTTPILDAALVRVRRAHGVWIGAQRAHLNARLAMVEADWRRLQPVAARAFGRVQALDGLIARAEAQARRDRAARALRDGPADGPATGPATGPSTGPATGGADPHGGPVPEESDGT